MDLNANAFGTMMLDRRRGEVAGTEDYLYMVQRWDTAVLAGDHTLAIEPVTRYVSH